MADARRAWIAFLGTLDPDCVVCLDETWAKENMTRTHGRCLCGERLYEGVPCRRWTTTTFLGAMRSTGFIAPVCMDGPVNGRMFPAWVRQHLCRELKPGDVVVMDNLSAHKVAGVREAIEAAGAKVAFLPAYSPDFNPIELAFSKSKKLLRDGAARTTDRHWELCGQVLDLFPPEQCRAYLRHCGYR